jgi:uncharacterized membrane protein YbhN (UPF0104 family)
MSMPAEGRARRRLGLAVRLLVAIGLVILILRGLNLGELRAVVIAPQWLPLAAMVAAALLFAFLGGLKIWIMLSALESIRLVTVLRHYVIATSLGSFTPAALGDFSLVGLLRRQGVPIHHGLSVMLVDRGITLTLPVLVYLPLTLLLILPARQWLWLPSLVGLAGAAVLGVNLVGPVRRWLRTRVVSRFLPKAEQFLRTASNLLRACPAALLADLAVTAVRTIVGGMVIAMALLAAGTRAGFVPVVALTNSLTLLNFVPISVSGVGVYEGGAVALFTRLGLSGERVLAAFVFQRVYIIVASLLWLALSRLVLPAAPRSGLPAGFEVNP